MKPENIYNKKRSIYPIEDGDYIVYETDNAKTIFIYKKDMSCICLHYYVCFMITKNNILVYKDSYDDSIYESDCRKATVYEINLVKSYLLDKYNAYWNESKKQLVEFNFIPENNQEYFYVDMNKDIIKKQFNFNDKFDINNVKNGNCFASKKDALLAAYKSCADL